tara:strand:+ start:113 stop:628 length:516 start_codon:yes stop_codon:yes gene_type:complete
MTEKKLTRKEKSEINKRLHAEITKERACPDIHVEKEPETQAEQKALFCELIAQCVSIDKAARRVGVNHRFIYEWLDEDEEFSKDYTRARERQADHLVGEIIQISDDGEGDLISDENGERVNHEVVARSRLRVDSRKWIAAKLRPRTYGDSTKIDATVSGSMTTKIIRDDIK